MGSSSGGTRVTLTLTGPEWAVKSQSTTHHAVSFNMESTSGSGSALNLVSANTTLSCLQVSGHESNKGTIKSSHVNPGPERGSDENAAVYSFDLQGGTIGSKSQGVFGTKTTFDKFEDGAFSGTHVLTSATAAFTALEDTGIAIKVPTSVITSGEATIEKVTSGTEVVLTGEAFKSTPSGATFEIGRNAGAWLTLRDTGKRLLARIRPHGLFEAREANGLPAVEAGCFCLYVKEGKLFLKLGAEAAKEITIP